jgi:hypothetical protein
MSSVSTSTEPPEPPDHGDEEEEEDVVVCFLSGARLHKSEAVRVRLGPGKVMWMAKELTNQG